MRGIEVFAVLVVLVGSVVMVGWAITTFRSNHLYGKSHWYVRDRVGNGHALVYLECEGEREQHIDSIPLNAADFQDRYTEAISVAEDKANALNENRRYLVIGRREAKS